jgi:uncharacterized OB-fold protein
VFRWFGRVGFTSHTRVSDFARQLKEGRIMASRCTACGHRAFPPRADCEACMGRAFEWVEISGRGKLHTWTTIAAAPARFEQDAPYTIGLLDLEEGGRALAWFGEGFPMESVAIGMPLRLVPRMLEEVERIHVFYSLEPAERIARDAAGPRGASAPATTDTRVGVSTAVAAGSRRP